MNHGLECFREEECRCRVCLQAMLDFMRQDTKDLDAGVDSLTKNELIRFRKET